MASGDLFVSNDIVIHSWELVEQFVRASGPGGQHVNKTSSAVQLRWNVAASPIPGAVKARFKKRYGARLTKEGDLVLEVKDHRSQALNREAARKRLKEMVASVAKPPKRRIATRPSRGAVQRRIKAKKVRGEVKALRGRVKDEE
ncbi:MAG: alternative ribosome rescue aminoacyl-tRNA hydrolase ArfB [Pseudomonadota bacterium]